jgi:hypothetical protein
MERSAREEELFVNLFSLLRRPSTPKPSCARIRPRLENLEARTLLSVDVGLTINGTTDRLYIPPDTGGAAGPDFYVETINLHMSYYRKDTGAASGSLSFQSLFAPLGDVRDLSDPVIDYDQFTGQFVVGVTEYTQPFSSICRFDFAVSNDSDPHDGWNIYRYDMNDGTASSLLADYPKMGYNADAYFISFNMFTTGFSHVDILSIDKSTLDGYRNIVPGGASNMTLVPAVMHDANPGDPEWLVESGSNSVKIVQMTNYLSFAPTFQIYNEPVAPFGSPPNARDAGGGTVPLSTLGTRFYSAAEMYGQLVAAHTVGTGGLAHVRWYQFDITGDSPVLVQSDEINPGLGVSTYFPAIDINVNGDLGMTYMESSSTEYVSMYVTGQNANDFGTSMQDGAVTHPGTTRYTISRVGDYSSVCVDPNDGITFWAANEYKGASAYNTGIASFGISPLGTVSAAVARRVALANSSPAGVTAAWLPASPVLSTDQLPINQALGVDWLFTSAPSHQAETPAVLVQAAPADTNLESGVWDGELGF